MLKDLLQPRNAYAFLAAMGFRRLRTATTGAALWIPATFEKVDETFIPSYLSPNLKYNLKRKLL